MDPLILKEPVVFEYKVVFSEKKQKPLKELR